MKIWDMKRRCEGHANASAMEASLSREGVASGYAACQHLSRLDVKIVLRTIYPPNCNLDKEKKNIYIYTQIDK